MCRDETVQLKRLCEDASDGATDGGVTGSDTGPPPVIDEVGPRASDARTFQLTDAAGVPIADPDGGASPPTVPPAAPDRLETAIEGWSQVDGPNGTGIVLIPPGPGTGQSARARLSCADTPHNVLSFTYLVPEQNGTLLLSLAGVTTRLPSTAPQQPFDFVALIPPEGSGLFEWEFVAGTQPAQDVWLDDVACDAIDVGGLALDPYEEAFIGGTLTGNWVLDNSDPHEGRFAARPPLLSSGGMALMQFWCDGSVTFRYKTGSGSVEALLFCDQGDCTPLPETSGSYDEYAGPSTDGLEATGPFSWQIAAAEPGQPAVWVDDIVCL